MSQTVSVCLLNLVNKCICFNLYVHNGICVHPSYLACTLLQLKSLNGSSLRTRILENVLILLHALALSTVGPTAVRNPRWGQDPHSHMDRVIGLVIYSFFFIITNVFSLKAVNTQCQRVSYTFFFP